VAQATVWGILFRVVVRSGNAFLIDLTLEGVLINLVLCFFNLIPLGPLDGHWLVGLLLPEKQRLYWYRFNRTVGMFALLILIFGSQIIPQFRSSGGILIFLFGAPISKLFLLLTGMPSPI
jgi:Zn-dependent protease